MCRIRLLTLYIGRGEVLFYADYDDSPDEESVQRITKWNLLFFSFVVLFIFKYCVC